MNTAKTALDALGNMTKKEMKDLDTAALRRFHELANHWHILSPEEVKRRVLGGK